MKWLLFGWENTEQMKDMHILLKDSQLHGGGPSPYLHQGYVPAIGDPNTVLEASIIIDNSII